MLTNSSAQWIRLTAHLSALTHRLVLQVSSYAKVPLAPRTAIVLRHAVIQTRVAGAHAKTHALTGTSHGTVRLTFAMGERAPPTLTALKVRARAVFAPAIAM